MKESTFDLTTGEPAKRHGKRRLLILGVLLGAVCLGLGVVIGYFGRSVPSPCGGICLPSDVPAKIIQDGEADIRNKIFNRISANNIRDNLRRFTEYPHLGGTKGEDDLGDELYDTWREQGLDHVTRASYEVLLSYPDLSDLNALYLLDQNGTVKYTSQILEANLTSDQDHPDIVPPFNAYSAPGDIKGPLVYVNYGRLEDYNRLAELNISVEGCIAIVRYGKIYRGDKVTEAEDHGATGIIMFSDPADHTSSSDVGSVYPDSWWLPPSGVQRGTIFIDDGDPLTPGFPATSTAYRMPESEANLPTIPAHPIGYGDAYHFLRHMSGPVAPDEWQGQIPELTYRLGPGFVNSGWKAHMHITTRNQLANSSNVFGFIYGSVEPDRYVLLGNHRDAWVFGAVDPTSGTANMMEVSRVLTSLVKEGWRPRRTIVFCSWGAEEYGLVGSVEWVEHYVKNLGERAVAYLNVDLAFEGQDSMRSRGVPILYDAIYHVATLLESPNVAGKKLYDEWMEHFPDGATNKPIIKGLGAGSDYKAFMEFSGVPCLDVRYTYDLAISSYPLYHSSYETFFLVENYMDPEFKYSAVIAKFWAEAARYLSDSLILPLGVKTYADSLKTMVVDLKQGYENLMNANGITLDGLDEAVALFDNTAVAFVERLSQVNENNPLEVRMYNDQMMLLDRAFLDPGGLPGRPQSRHVLFAASIHDAYAGSTFPGLVDLMFEIEKMENSTQQWVEVRKHLATVTFMIESAASSLRAPDAFC